MVEAASLCALVSWQTLVVSLESMPTTDSAFFTTALGAMEARLIAEAAAPVSLPAVPSLVSDGNSVV